MASAALKAACLSMLTVGAAFQGSTDDTTGGSFADTVQTAAPVLDFTKSVLTSRGSLREGLAKVTQLKTSTGYYTLLRSSRSFMDRWPCSNEPIFVDL